MCRKCETKRRDKCHDKCRDKKCRKRVRKDPTFGCEKIVGLPPCGKIGVGFGQTTDALSAFRKEVIDVDPIAPYPYVINLYTDLVRYDPDIPQSGFLAGLGSVNVNADGSLKTGFLPWSNGVASEYTCESSYIFNEVRNGGLTDFMNFQATLSEFPQSILSIGLKLGEDATNEPIKAVSALYTGQNPFGLSQEILDSYKVAVDTLICWCKDQCPRDILIRPMYEIDADFKQYAIDNSTEYAMNTFRYLKTRFVEEKVKNVAFMLHYFAQDYGQGGPGSVYDLTAPDHYDIWYPGDEFVDWIGMSNFLQDKFPHYYQLRDCFYENDSDARDRVYNFARQHNKPVDCASEMSPVAVFFPQDNVFGCAWFCCDLQFETTSQEIWDNIFVPFFQEIEQNKDVIRLCSNYINTHWYNNSCWGDSRLQSNDFLRNKFFSQLKNDSKFFIPKRPCLKPSICDYPFVYPCIIPDSLPGQCGANSLISQSILKIDGKIEENVEEKEDPRYLSRIKERK